MAKEGRSMYESVNKEAVLLGCIEIEAVIAIGFFASIWIQARRNQKKQKTLNERRSHE